MMIQERFKKVRAILQGSPPATKNEPLKSCPFCRSPAKHVRESDGHMLYRFVRCTKNPEHRAGNGCYNGAPGRNGDSGKCDHCWKLGLECLYAEQEWQLRE